MENPIKMDDLGVPLFSETSIYVRTKCHLGEWLFMEEIQADQLRLIVYPIIYRAYTSQVV